MKILVSRCAVGNAIGAARRGRLALAARAFVLRVMARIIMSSTEDMTLQRSEERAVELAGEKMRRSAGKPWAGFVARDASARNLGF